MSKWSASIEVIQRRSGWSVKKERSNSSASTTIYSLPSLIKLEPKLDEIPPKNAVIFFPLSRRICARIEDVVVLPWVPPTAKQFRSLLNSPRTSERLKTSNPFALKNSSCGEFWGIAGVNTTVVLALFLHTDGIRSTRSSVCTFAPIWMSLSVISVSMRSYPYTSCPCWTKYCANADIPIPPIPKKYSCCLIIDKGFNLFNNRLSGIWFCQVFNVFS